MINRLDAGLRRLVATNLIGMLFVDVSGKILDVDESFLQTLGYNRNDRKYLMFADKSVYCGIATYIADTRAGLGNRNNGGPSYGRVDSGCWSSVMAARSALKRWRQCLSVSA